MKVAKAQVRLAPSEMQACQNNPIGMKPKTKVSLSQFQLSWCKISSSTTRPLMIQTPLEAAFDDPVMRFPSKSVLGRREGIGGWCRGRPAEVLLLSSIGNGPGCPNSVLARHPVPIDPPQKDVAAADRVFFRCGGRWIPLPARLGNTCASPGSSSILDKPDRVGKPERLRPIRARWGLLPTLGAATNAGASALLAGSKVIYTTELSSVVD